MERKISHAEEVRVRRERKGVNSRTGYTSGSRSYSDLDLVAFIAGVINITADVKAAIKHLGRRSEGRPQSSNMSGIMMLFDLIIGMLEVCWLTVRNVSISSKNFMA